MLFKDPFIVSPETFSLVQQLQALPVFNGFYLVGRTALALQLGHRNSIDIDLFTHNDFSAEQISEALDGKFAFRFTFTATNTVLSVVNEIKRDFIKHNYPLINQPITEEGITFLSKEDIAAMKLHAIIQSGKRIKDFIDVFFLLQHFSLNKLIEFFTAKYPYTNSLIALRALNFFGDIDETIDPPKMIKPLKMETIKKRIQEASLHPFKTF
jgi:hypothetical protein